MQPVIIAATCLLLAPPFARAAQVDGPDQPAPTATAPRDPQLAAGEVETALRETDGVPRSVVVSTHADTIVLTGQVDSELDASRAVVVAEETAAGVRISSQLEVRPGAGATLATRRVSAVEQALRADPRTANLGISVSIDDGQVIGLHGLVASAENRRVAEEVASRVPGVPRVRSHLVVPGE